MIINDDITAWLVRISLYTLYQSFCSKEHKYWDFLTELCFHFLFCSLDSFLFYYVIVWAQKYLIENVLVSSIIESCDRKSCYICHMTVRRKKTYNSLSTIMVLSYYNWQETIYYEIITADTCISWWGPFKELFHYHLQSWVHNFVADTILWPIVINNSPFS